MMATQPIRSEPGGKLAERDFVAISFPDSCKGVKKQKACKLSQGHKQHILKLI